MKLAPVLVAAGIAALVPAAPAGASCAKEGLSALARREQVVVGQVLEQRGPRALLAVEEVWAGADRPPRLWVGTREDGGATTSVDVVLVTGQSYVLALYGDEPRTNLCSVQVVQPSQLGPVRPAEARPPVVGAG